MRDIKINGIYKHFKGHIIKVIALGKDVDNLSEKVIYEHQETKEIWIRDKNEFLSEVDHVKYPLVKQKYRFEEVEN